MARLAFCCGCMLLCLTSMVMQGCDQPLDCYLNEICSAECISSFCTDEDIRAKGVTHACSMVNGISAEKQSWASSIVGTGINGMRTLEQECRTKRCEQLDDCFSPRLTDEDWNKKEKETKEKFRKQEQKKKDKEEDELEQMRQEKQAAKDEKAEEDGFLEVGADAHVVVEPSGATGPLGRLQPVEARKVEAGSTEPTALPKKEANSSAIEALARRTV